MTGDVGQFCEVDADELHGRGEALFRRQVEDDGKIGGHGEPGVLGEFLLELPKAVQVLRLVTSDGVVGATR